jgi:hypothetical protein
MSVKSVIKTACVICQARCGLIVHLESGEIARIAGDPESPVKVGPVASLREQFVRIAAFGPEPYRVLAIPWKPCQQLRIGWEFVIQVLQRLSWDLLHDCRRSARNR